MCNFEADRDSSCKWYVCTVTALLCVWHVLHYVIKIYIINIYLIINKIKNFYSNNRLKYILIYNKIF